VASLDHWSSAPVVTRFYAEWFAVRALAHAGHLDHAEQQLKRITPFVTDLGSRHASRLLADLHGVVAMERHDWQGAAHWYGKVDEATEGGLSTWFDLVAAWHLLTARCLSPEPVDISGAELRDPWNCCMNEHIDVLQLHGAVSTALALHRLGRDDLADRFAAWACATDPEAMQGAFTTRLQAGGLPTTKIEPADDLQALIDELFIVADRLDDVRA
jgi:hypothetical protein